MFKEKNPNKLFLIFASLLLIIFAISIFLSKVNKGNTHTIRAKLITSVHKDLPFEFKAEDKNITISPGQVKTINYSVKNLGKKSMTGTATFQVYPSELKDYMTKMNCFCYDEQTLKGGEEEKYSLILIVDPKVTKNIKEAIIQFVFFKK